MGHQEFVSRYKFGELELRVNRATLRHQLRSGILPQRKFNGPKRLWLLVWIMCAAVCTTVSVAVKWWIGPILLFVLTAFVYEAVEQSVERLVLGHTIQSQEFYDFGIDTGLLRVIEKPMAQP